MIDFGNVLAWIGVGMLWLMDLGFLAADVLLAVLVYYAVQDRIVAKRAKKYGLQVDPGNLVITVGMLIVMVAITVGSVIGTARLTGNLIG